MEAEIRQKFPGTDVQNELKASLSNVSGKLSGKSSKNLRVFSWIFFEELLLYIRKKSVRSRTQIKTSCQDGSSGRNGPHSEQVDAAFSEFSEKATSDERFLQRKGGHFLFFLGKSGKLRGKICQERGVFVLISQEILKKLSFFSDFSENQLSLF